MKTDVREKQLIRLLRHLSRVNLLLFLNALLVTLDKQLVVGSRSRANPLSHPRYLSIRGLAAAINAIPIPDEQLESYLYDWLLKDVQAMTMASLDIRRAALAVLASRGDKIQQVLEYSLAKSGDKPFIRNAPITYQEALTEIILLSVGHLNRTRPDQLKKIYRSSLYLNCVSNRLGASGTRARYMGMIIGTAISSVLDQPDKSLKFPIAEMDSMETIEWLSLAKLQDSIGSIGELQEFYENQGTNAPQPVAAAIRRGNSKHAELQERGSGLTHHHAIVDEIREPKNKADENADGLSAYDKPDEDPPDSDEDPTLVNREKPSAPLYVRDLVKYLQASERPELVEIALQTAPFLIRQKAKFGTELPDNVLEVASALINLQEGMSSQETHIQRFRSLMACIVALPDIVGPWATSIYFEADFSLQQRASLLTAIGLGARELAGYSDDLNWSQQPTAFPSKHLPEHIAVIYSPVDRIARQIENSTLQPLALAAADKVTGPDILKVRTFSSRIDIAKKASQMAKSRQTRIPKDLHKLLADRFYIPLCCRMSLLLSSRSFNPNHILLEPHLVKLFLQTLLIILTTLGPHALQLSSVTRETLILLMCLHAATAVSLDPVVLPLMVQLLLTVLDINMEAGGLTEEQLITSFGSMIAELLAWTNDIKTNFSVPPGDPSEGVPWEVIAASCQIKWQELGRKFQGRMMGLISSDLYGF